MAEILAYARVSTSDQSRDGRAPNRSANTTRTCHPRTSTRTWGGGDDPTRDEYVEPRDRVEEGDAGKVVAAKLDRLGRSTAEVADFVDTCSDRGVGLHLVQQGFNVDPDDEMGQMMLKFMSMVAEMELKLNRERRQEGIERAIDRGVQFGRAPHGMTKTRWEFRCRERGTSGCRRSSGRFGTDARSDQLPDSSTFPKGASRRSSTGQTNSTESTSTTIAGRSTEQKSRLARKRSNRSEKSNRVGY